jgi:hypothetical protein
MLTAPPVDSRQNESDIHFGIDDTLSKQSSQLFWAAIAKSLSSLGRDRESAKLGSMQRLIILELVDLAEPWAPMN